MHKLINFFRRNRCLAFFINAFVIDVIKDHLVGLAIDACKSLLPFLFG